MQKLAYERSAKTREIEELHKRTILESMLHKRKALDALESSMAD